MSILSNPITVTVNGVSLDTVPGLTLLNRPINDLPERAITELSIARANKSQTVNAQYTHKILPIEGVIDRGSRALTEASIDQLKSICQGSVSTGNCTLVIQQSGSSRQYTATVHTLTTDLTGGHCEFKMEWQCSDPIGYDTSTSVFLASTVNTLSNASFSVLNGGSFDARPVITATLNSGTGLTGNMTIVSTNDNIGVTINRTWTAGDVVVIDCANKNILVNNGIANYSGRFPVFNSGSGAIGYSDQFTTRNVTLSATYVRRFA